MHRSLVMGLATMLVVAGCGITARPAARPHPFWQVAYNGYGRVMQSSASALTPITLIPARPTSPSATHAALALSRSHWRDVALTIRIRTNHQFRADPNPWEVAWLLWHYRSDQHFYYIVLKPNGWELGKEDPAYPGNQRYLATGAHPVFPPGHWYTVAVRQRGDVITVDVDGRHLVSFTDSHDPYLGGQVGLYAEDASATFQPVAIGALP